MHGRKPEKDSMWQLHASARFSSEPPPETTMISPETIRARMNREIPADVLYDRFRKRGLEYGPFFQSIHGLWMGKGWTGLARLALDPRLDATGSATGYPHRCSTELFKRWRPCSSPRREKEPEGLALPVSIERVRWYSRTPKEIWAHVRGLERNGRKVTGRVSLLG